MHLAQRLFFLATALLLGTTVVLMVAIKQLGSDEVAYMLAMLLINLLSVGIPVVGGYGAVLGIVALVLRWRKRRTGLVKETESEADPIDADATPTSARPRY